MIVHKWCGRYGRMANQMFQFAAAVGLAKKHNTDWAVLNGMPTLDLNRAFKLPNTKWINESEVRHFHRYIETNKGFDSRFLSQPSQTLVEGYFQTEKYFAHCKDTILEEFSFKDEFHSMAIEKKKTLGDKPLCSIHVRRGDYLSLPNHHPIPSLMYYDSALEIVREYCKDFNIVYFTDDPNWVGYNMIPEFGGVVARGSAYEDLCLMSMCDYNIIANSSFSWWGAWLNQKENKVVVCPRTWFGPAVKNAEKFDIVCEGWFAI